MSVLLLSVLIATVTAREYRLTSYPSGRLEVNFGNGWNEVCGHWFWNSQHGAYAACQKMGYPNGGSFRRTGHRLVNPVYIGNCNAGQAPGDCTGGCCTGGGHCRNQVNCGDCRTNEPAGVIITCTGPRTQPPTSAAPTTAAPTPSPTSSPTEEASYGNIIEWLRQLIAEGQAEIGRINDKTTVLTNKLGVAQNALAEAEKKEGAAEAAKDAAAAALGRAQGAWATCLNTFSSEMKRLNEEIAIFKKVKDILAGLINGKQLLEEEKADVKALISEADQADPAKVQKIIALVQVLIEAAEAEIKKITNDKDQCWRKLKAAETANAKAIGIWRACQKAVEDAENAVATAKGERDAHIEYANKRIAVVNGEIEQFEEIIVLLQPLFE